MPKELLWLTWTTILTGVLWIPYVLDRIMVRGLFGAMANPTPKDEPHSVWAQRLMRAHTNAIENLVVFATLVLILRSLNISTAATVTACAIFFFARLAHAIVYMLGIPVVRTLTFAIGFAAEVVLALAIFGM
jgi:uncharacterized MAPEG superfamily protein